MNDESASKFTPNCLASFFSTPHSPLPSNKSYGYRIFKFDPACASAVRAPPGISRLFGRRLALRGDQRDLHSAAGGVQPAARRRGEVSVDDVNAPAVVRDAVRPAPARPLPAPHLQAVRAGGERGRAHPPVSAALSFERVDVPRPFQRMPRGF